MGTGGLFSFRQRPLASPPPDDAFGRFSTEGSEPSGTVLTIQKRSRLADAAIHQERSGDVVAFSAEDAPLVLCPGREAHGKAEIRRAFVAIAEHFTHSPKPPQGSMVFPEADDTAPVLSRSFVNTPEKRDSAYPSAPGDICIWKHKRTMALRRRQLVWGRPSGYLKGRRLRRPTGFHAFFPAGSHPPFCTQKSAGFRRRSPYRLMYAQNSRFFPSLSNTWQALPLKVKARSLPGAKVSA